jgi:hypothetical protein
VESGTTGKREVPHRFLFCIADRTDASTSKPPERYDIRMLCYRTIRWKSPWIGQGRMQYAPTYGNGIHGFRITASCGCVVMSVRSSISRYTGGSRPALHHAFTQHADFVLRHFFFVVLLLYSRDRLLTIRKMHPNTLRASAIFSGRMQYAPPSGQTVPRLFQLPSDTSPPNRFQSRCCTPYHKRRSCRGWFVGWCKIHCRELRLFDNIFLRDRRARWCMCCCNFRSDCCL